VLSLATVTGRMIASAVLDDGEDPSLDAQIRVVKRSAPELAGTTIGRADVRSRTGCTVVALVNDGEVSTDIGPDRRVRPEDELILVGTDEGVGRFTDRFGDGSA
jgi:K+/H+ antiporter YhaU regulatory subunit KhtT